MEDSLWRLAEAEWAQEPFPTWRETRGQGEWGNSPWRMDTDKKSRVMTAFFTPEDRVTWKRFWKPSLCGSKWQSRERQTGITEKKSWFQIRKNFLIIHCSTSVRNWPGWSYKTPYNPVWDRSLSGLSWEPRPQTNRPSNAILSRDSFTPNSLDKQSLKDLPKVPDSGGGGGIMRAFVPRSSVWYPFFSTTGPSTNCNEPALPC